MGIDHREGRPNSVKIVPSAVRYSEPMQDLCLAVTAIVFDAGVEIASLLAWGAPTWLLRSQRVFDQEAHEMLSAIESLQTWPDPDQLEHTTDAP